MLSSERCRGPSGKLGFGDANIENVKLQLPERELQALEFADWQQLAKIKAAVSFPMMT